MSQIPPPLSSPPSGVEKNETSSQWLEGTSFSLVQPVAPAAKTRAVTGSRIGPVPPNTARSLATAFRHRWPSALLAGVILTVAFGTATWVLRPDKATTIAVIRVAPFSATRVLQDTERPNDSDQSYMR